MNTCFRSIAVLLAALLVQGAWAQFNVSGPGFLPDKNGINLDAPEGGKASPNLRAGNVIKDCAECPEMVVVPTGGFTMGSTAEERALSTLDGLDAEFTTQESPTHYVQVMSFAMGRHPVTKGQFAMFQRASGYRTEAEQMDGCERWTGEEIEKDPAYNWRSVGFPQGDDHPVVCVSWNDAQAYIQWLSQISGISFRLPSEAEREYSTRGEKQTAFWWGERISTTQANYNGNSSYNGSQRGQFRQTTVPVNSFSPNPFGLYNVHGNVWEWTHDCWHESYVGAPTDGSAWISDCDYDFRVLRGGSWQDGSALLRSAVRAMLQRDTRDNTSGFRLARDL